MDEKKKYELVRLLTALISWVLEDEKAETTDSAQLEKLDNSTGELKVT